MAPHRKSFQSAKQDKAIMSLCTKFLDICSKICADNIIICPTKFLGGSKLCQESSACSDISAIFSEVIQVSAATNRPISNRIHI